MLDNQNLIDIPKNELGILVVQDFSLLLRVMLNLLQEIGYTKVGTTHNGNSAKVMLERLDIDLLIMDMHIPGLSGMDILKFLRKHKNKHLQQLPVLLTSHVNEKKTVKKLALAGADSFLLKPFDKQGLHEAIIKTLVHRDEVRPINIPQNRKPKSIEPEKKPNKKK